VGERDDDLLHTEIVLGISTCRKASDAKVTRAPVKITGIAKKILLDFDKIKKDGATVFVVFARVKGEDKWYELGNIASVGDLTKESCLVPLPRLLNLFIVLTWHSGP
jgi:hypothetical protein